MAEFERIEHQHVFGGKVFQVERDRVRMPNGRTVTVDIIRHPPSAVIVPIPEPGHIILVRQYRYVVNRWLWELPAGSAEENEPVDMAARRECHEEIGQVPDTLVRLGSWFPSPGYSDEEMVFFRASGLSPASEPAAVDEDEDIEVRTFTLRDVRDMIRRGEIIDMKTLIGLSLI
jgi:ADP-ribose pyrophosphatase